MAQQLNSARFATKVLGPELDEVRKSGAAFLHGFALGMPTAQVAALFGPVASMHGIAAVQILTPRERETSPPNIYSGNFGTGEFPLHTDMAHWAIPPRFLLLRCVVGSHEVPTRLLDSAVILAQLPCDILARTLARPRRPFGHSQHLLRLWQTENDSPLFRWDRLFLTPASTNSVEVFGAVTRLLDSASPADVILSNPGDTLIVDNWRMLHGRAPVPATAAGRCIERTYLSSLH
jgi:hypothetical protein